MNKIRFVNPIKECIEIQGKVYTVVLIATIIMAIALSIVSGMIGMPICATVSAILGIGCTIGFGWWFGVKPIPMEDE